jgi:hypothetical protein
MNYEPGSNASAHRGLPHLLDSLDELGELVLVLGADLGERESSGGLSKMLA